MLAGNLPLNDVTQSLLGVTQAQQLIEGRTSGTVCASYPPITDVSSFYSAPVPLEFPGKSGDSFQNSTPTAGSPMGCGSFEIAAPAIGRAVRPVEPKPLFTLRMGLTAETGKRCGT